MATAEATPQEIFDAIQALRLQRAQADTIMAGPYVDGKTDLWKRKTLSLLRVALPDGHYALETFERAGAGSYRMIPMASAAVQESVRMENVRKAIGAHLACLDDAIVEAETRLSRMGSSGPSLGTPPPSGSGSLPNVDFAFVRDPKLRAMAQRDYAELRIAVLNGSVKSMGTLAGSVVEAVVIDLLLAKSIPFAEIDQMKAWQLYERAKKEGALAGRNVPAAQAARDVRNFVHPAVEYREGVLTKTQAELGVSLMRAILGELGVL